MQNYIQTGSTEILDSHIWNDDTSNQAYKIHGTVGLPVPEKNWPHRKLSKLKKKKKTISEKNEMLT